MLEEILTELVTKAGDELEHYCSELLKTVNKEDVSKTINADEKKSMMSLINNTMKWIDGNLDSCQSAFEEKKSELEKIYSKVLDKMSKGKDEMPGGPGEAAGDAVEK
ncbi:unnamed protein product [Didymodactylos carnosus]|uniref:Uncharacterized protein n=1 Tax=Didymodactylos carnosus TaxID=1234261 RepID=A0A815Y2Z5_9BILA|nr:unnamed protein product [Didymodactylos carnosus]CAF1565109.1 unnamed protein product [Didymodactylos carnosus]CAF4147146.1 unnamed protein product [Didymodactylos carnosus]CAF4427101.1 unnamed protein product [Didymodactylos carnosus]